ncbi:uncharacterized protein LOC143857808 isoform X2 [Tasmannia lanceolata]
MLRTKQCGYGHRLQSGTRNWRHSILPNSSISRERETSKKTKVSSDSADEDYRTFQRLAHFKREQNDSKNLVEDNDLHMNDESYMKFLIHQREDNDVYCVDDDVDPVYKTFLENLREDGKSYVLEMINKENGMPLYVKYEGVDESADEIDSKTWRMMGCILSGERGTCIDEKTRKPHMSGLDSRKNRSSRRNPGKFIYHPASPNCEYKEELSLVDDSYETFLNNVRLHGDSFILELEDGTSLKYEEDTEILTASERLASESTPYCGDQQLTEYKSSEQHRYSSMCEDDESSIDSLYDSSYFKDKLMAVLNKPYDHNEYEELWEQVNAHKPMERQRNLRLRSVSYATKGKGMSYLDYHPDLAKQFKSADPHQALTLLRGFFFWLKNLSHDGAFKPWITPPNCLDLIPTSTYEMMPPIQIAMPENFESELFVAETEEIPS